MRAARAILPALAALLLAFPARSAPLIVTDGDSLRMGGERIRLWGIDAPERGQTCRRGRKRYDCGAAATRPLHSFIGGRPVTCVRIETDRYGRTVARCMAGGNDLGRLMVASGWALDMPRYSGGAYAADQRGARRERRGLWAGSFVAPSRWRKGS